MYCSRMFSTDVRFRVSTQRQIGVRFDHFFSTLQCITMVDKSRLLMSLVWLVFLILFAWPMAGFASFFWILLQVCSVLRYY